MKKEKTEKIIVMISLFVAIITLAVGFAAFSNTLTISSSATVSPNPRDFKLDVYGVEELDLRLVHYPNIYTSPTKSVPFVTGKSTAEDAIISNSTTDSGTNKIKITNLKANLKEPYESVEYLFMVKNESKYDAYLMASEFNKILNIKDKTTCEAVVKEGNETATKEYVDAACKDIIISVSILGGETMDTIFETNVYDSNNNYTDEYLKISKKGTQFLEYDFGYAIISVQISYLGENLADGDFEVEFDDIELEFTTTPPAE